MIAVTMTMLDDTTFTILAKECEILDNVLVIVVDSRQSKIFPHVSYLEVTIDFMESPEEDR